MASFQEAFKNTSQNEGGWTVDNGGQTYKGISRKGWPKWAGWVLIDRWIQNNGMPKHKQVLNIPGLDDMIVSFYKKNYWDRIAGDFIKIQTVAGFVFDFAINSGSGIKIMNNALGGRESAVSITEDSLRVINERPAFAYEAIRVARKNWYDKLKNGKGGAKLVKNNTYKGWISRLNKFPETLTQTA